MYCYGKSRCYPFISIVAFCAYEDEHRLVRSMIEHCYQLSDVIMIVGLGGNTHRCDTTTWNCTTTICHMMPHDLYIYIVVV